MNKKDWKKDSKKENKKEKSENFSLGWKRFILELKNRKKDTVLLLVFSFLVFVPFSFEKFIFGKILDSLINKSNTEIFNFQMESVYFFIGVLVIVGIIWRIFDVLSYGYLGPKISNEVYKDYTKKVFRRIISYPTSFFKNNAIGKTTYSINTGAETLSTSYLSFLDMVGFPFLVISNTFFLFLVSWHAGIVVLTTSIIYIIFFQKTIKMRQKLTKSFNSEKKGITTFLTENINLSIEIKKNSSENKENNILGNKLRGSFDKKFNDKLRFDIITNIFVEFLFFITVITNLLLIIWLYKNKLITEGDFLAIILYEGAVIRNVGYIIKHLNKYIEDFTIIGDTEKLLLQDPENYSVGKVSGIAQGEIEYKNVYFEYDFEPKNSVLLSENFSVEDTEKKETEKKIFSLQNINLKIEKGQKVAFVGESGGGKSTTVELIGGFYFPNSGKVLIDGISVKDWNLNNLRSSIAYVSQDIAIFNSTIGENIVYGVVSEISENKVKKAAKLANISEFIENLPDGYQTKVGEKGLKLSGGQKQRIAIARAILRDPKILILDEPTSALDIVSEKYITESLKTLMKNRTTIIIAHRLSTVADADKIFVFKEGQIVESGNYKELIFQNGEFKRMVDLHKELK